MSKKQKRSNSLHLHWSKGDKVPRNTNLPWAQQMFGQHQAAFCEQRKGKRIYPLSDLLQVVSKSEARSDACIFTTLQISLQVQWQ